MLKKNSRLLSASLLIILLVLGSALPLTGQEQFVARSKPVRLVRLKNPEATGLLLNLLARYASDVPNSEKSDYDKAVDKKLGGNEKVKVTARRMLERVKKNSVALRGLPKEFAEVSPKPIAVNRYKSAFEKWKADTTTSVNANGDTTSHVDANGEFVRVTSPATEITLYYRGLRCLGETDDGSASDEPYLITSIVEVDNNNKVTTVKHPFGGKSYEDIDAGEKPDGPEVSIYKGKAQDLTVIAVMMEYDFGDPDYWRDEIDAAVKLSLGACQAAGCPIPDGVADAATDLLNMIAGTEDDFVAQDNRFFEKSRLLGWDTSNLQDKEKVPNPGGGPELEIPAAHRYHFRTSHKGDGGWYRAYYRVKRTQ